MWGMFINLYALFQPVHKKRRLSKTTKSKLAKYYLTVCILTAKFNISIQPPMIHVNKSKMR